MSGLKVNGGKSSIFGIDYCLLSSDLGPLWLVVRWVSFHSLTFSGWKLEEYCVLEPGSG